MDKFLFPELSIEDRKSMLQSQADKVVVENYHVRLTEDQLTSKRFDFTNNGLELQRLEVQKKETLKMLKDEMDPLKTANKELGLEINSGFVEISGELFVMIDQETKMAYHYNSEGELIVTKTRPATRDELQQVTIFQVSREKREGTNG